MNAFGRARRKPSQLTTWHRDWRAAENHCRQAQHTAGRQSRPRAQPLAGSERPQNKGPFHVDWFNIPEESGSFRTFSVLVMPTLDYSGRRTYRALEESSFSARSVGIIRGARPLLASRRARVTMP
jgi:hypothetical protein